MTFEEALEGGYQLKFRPHADGVRVDLRREGCETLAYSTGANWLAALTSLKRPGVNQAVRLRVEAVKINYDNALAAYRSNIARLRDEYGDYTVDSALEELKRDL